MHVRSNGVELCYDEVGRGDPIVLIMGIGAQMIWWPDAFCAELAEAGFRVIRFDNRDIGGSTYLHHLKAPNLARVTRQRWLGQPVDAPYGLDTMALDTVGLLDALDIPQAHVVGASMGGMIAQHVAFEHPDRILSLTSLMSTTGALAVSMPHPRAVQALFAGRPAEAGAAIEAAVYVARTLGSRGLTRDEERVRDVARRCIERGTNPEGFLRQWAAIMASGDRTARLGSIRAPTLVMHGTIDPLVPPAGGRATAKAIPGARLTLIDGMGHDVPEGAWTRMIEEIRAVADRAGPESGRRFLSGGSGARTNVG
jgi:pimeloyl-ACP methyl ester carboxylesterase